MSNGKIYRKTIVFSLPRLPFLLLASLCFLVCVVIGCFLSWLYPLYGESIRLLSVLGGALAFYFFNGYGKKRYRTAQIAMITRALTTGSLPPDHVFQAGTDKVKQLFESRSISQFAHATGHAALLRIVRRKTRAAVIRARGRSWLADARSMAVFYGGNLIPYLGFCTLGYEFAHEEQPMLRAVCDGVEAFFRNLTAMGKRIKHSLACQGFFYVTLGLIALVPLYRYNCGHAFFKEICAAWVDASENIRYSSRQIAPESLALLTSVMQVILLMLELKLFVQPLAIVFTVRRYLECCADNPPKGAVFRVLPERIKREMRQLTPEAEPAAEHRKNRRRTRKLSRRERKSERKKCESRQE